MKKKRKKNKKPEILRFALLTRQIAYQLCNTMLSTSSVYSLRPRCSKHPPNSAQKIHL